MISDQDLAAYVKQDPNILGEILRDWAFVGPGLGCYSNFDVLEEFAPVEPTEREFRFLFGRDYNPGLVPEGGWGDDDMEYLKSIKWFKHPNGLEMGWFWDGDGTLAFLISKDTVLINHDCKHTDEWSFWKDKQEVDTTK